MRLAISRVAYLLERTNVGAQCWNWTAHKNEDGYGTGSVNGKLCGAHRMAYEAFVCQVPPGMMVLHRCDNRRCINPLHLFLGTNQDNMDDMVRKGRAAKAAGELNSNARLKTSDVLMIRSSPASAAVLSDKFGICRNLVYQIRARKAWRHLP